MSKGSRGGYNMGGMNRNQMMAQARKMQEQLVAAQQQAAATEVSASAGGGTVKVSATGDPQALDPDDVDMLQDMVLAAVNDALEQAESATEKAMGSVTGGLNIPGLF